MSFDTYNLHPLIVRNLNKLGYFSPRPIQAQAIGPVMAGSDVIGLAQTGTGKTAAFIAPIAHQLISDRPPTSIGKLKDPMTRLRALVLCPTRELAQQVAAEAAGIVQGTVLRTACAYGKVSIARQAEQISRGVDILIATPGRVRELLEHGGGGGGSSLSLAYVRHVAIDEADRMLDMGFLPQVTQILKAVPGQRQMLLFTSTMPAEVEDLARQFMRDPVRIEAEPHTTTAPHLQQHLLPVDEDDKVLALIHLLSHPPRKGVLVFCRTKRRVGWVGTALQRNNISTSMLHGDRTQSQRQDALDKFSSGERVCWSPPMSPPAACTFRRSRR
jgi:superfamily II DNA/RNA helicase